MLAKTVGKPRAPRVPVAALEERVRVLEEQVARLEEQRQLLLDLEARDAPRS